MQDGLDYIESGDPSHNGLLPGSEWLQLTRHAATRSRSYFCSTRFRRRNSAGFALRWDGERAACVFRHSAQYPPISIREKETVNPHSFSSAWSIVFMAGV